MSTNNMALMARSFSCETRFLLLLILMSDMTNGGMQGSMEGYNLLEEHMLSMSTTQFPPTTLSYVHPKWMEPYFDPSTPRNVTALMGKSAYLSCRVRNLGNKTVSWIRHRDIHILTVGAYTYTSDQRFQATHHHDTDDWTLQIKWAQKRDAGMYECQISTQPVRSYFVRLNVVVPTATILGGPDLHVDKGSTINLTCTVKFSPEPPAYIFWYHHDEVINYDSSRGGVSVITEKGDVTTSFLLIQNADLADSGKYSCAPSNADVASVRVHVLNGEHPEAMQTGSSGCQFSWLTIFLLAALVLCYHQQYLAVNATSAMGGVAATATATKLNMTENGNITGGNATDSPLLHIKSKITNTIKTTTTTAAVLNSIMNKRPTTAAVATDVYVTPAAQHTTGVIISAPTLLKIATTMATSAITATSKIDTPTTATQNGCCTTNMPTSPMAGKLNVSSILICKMQLSQSRCSSGRGSSSPPKFNCCTSNSKTNNKQNSAHICKSNKSNCRTCTADNGPLLATASTRCSKRRSKLDSSQHAASANKRIGDR